MSTEIKTPGEYRHLLGKEVRYIDYEDDIVLFVSGFNPDIGISLTDANSGKWFVCITKRNSVGYFTERYEEIFKIWEDGIKSGVLNRTKASYNMYATCPFE
jgi:hypothetical protein